MPPYTPMAARLTFGKVLTAVKEKRKPLEQVVHGTVNNLRRL
jgi:hypothetical protein